MPRSPRCQRDGEVAIARGSSSNIQRAKLRRPHSPLAATIGDRARGHRPGARARRRVASTCGDRRTGDARRRALVVADHDVRLERPADDDRFGRDPAGQQRLPDALAGHHVGCGGGVADEQDTRPDVSEISSIRAGIGQAVCRPSSCEVGSERLDDVRTGEQVAPQLAHLLHPTSTVAQHAEPDVDPVAGQRERPGVARQQVFLEPHDQTLDAGPVTLPAYWRKACHSPR